MHVTAAEILEWAHRCKIPQISLTNTTSRPRPAIADKVERMGIRIDPGRILTPPAAARRCLLEYEVDGVALGEPPHPPATTPARGPPAWDDDLEPMPDWDLIAQPHPGFVFGRVEMRRAQP
jgi:hypothetical protein